MIQVQTILILKFKKVDTLDVIPKKFYSQFKDHISHGLSFLHISIKIVNKNFENFKLFLSSLGFTFSVICFSQTQFDRMTNSDKSLRDLPNYLSVHQVRKQSRGRGVSLYIHQFVKFKMQNDLSIKLFIFTEDVINNVSSIFKKKYLEIDWQEIETSQNPYDAYTYFLEQFFAL